ncbi:MAG: hypothetical protein ALECFALPRED_002144 [Alectoria fallacina]|uniref:Uncharacterized protein n=1 Tax=Alectoria fallacina TaxID=1903189 RepID=A0A8H3FDQ1_9LECA|nr:MAG: hypothetical protein ALECFALPRED_002144 [Alectoria fallacina]
MLIFGQPQYSLPNGSRDCPIPVNQMGLQDSPRGTQADPAGFPNELLLDVPNLAQAARLRGFNKSNNGECDVYVPRQRSNRKRTASQRPEILHTTPKSTKRDKITDNVGIIVISDEDSDAPSASVSRNRHRKSPLTAFGATIKVEDDFTSPLNTPTSRPIDDSALGADALADGDDGEPLSPPHEESLKAANESPCHSGPGLDTSDPIHDQATNKTSQLDGIVIEEQHTPSLPSPSASSTGTREHSQNAPEPGVQIQYFIIKARTTRLSYTRWPEGTLRDKTLGSIFDEVARYTSKTKIRKIRFKLDTSRAEIEYPIRRGDENTFDDMKRDFDDEELRVDKKNGNTVFKIWLEPDPTE